MKARDTYNAPEGVGTSPAAQPQSRPANDPVVAIPLHTPGLVRAVTFTLPPEPVAVMTTTAVYQRTVGQNPPPPNYTKK